MQLSTIILLVTALLLCQIHCQTPPSWGGNPRYTVKAKLLNNDPILTWNFTYYYDWNLKVERYEHEAPEVDEMCVLPTTSFQKNGLPCHVTFATDGWSYIQFPTKSFCCKCSKNFGAIAYDWLKENSTYVGIQTVNGKSCTHWTKQGLYLNNYWSTVDKQLPVKFFEIKKGNPKSWDFDLDTYTTAPIDPEKFKPKCTNRCLGYCQILAPVEQNLKKQ